VSNIIIMTSLFVLLYIHTDCIEYSEVLGLYYDKEEVVNALIEYAHYRENGHGILTQYFYATDEYESMDKLREKVMNDMCLVDSDIYKILEVIV
jgi:hypothetical protein